MGISVDTKIGKTGDFSQAIMTGDELIVEKALLEFQEDTIDKAVKQLEHKNYNSCKNEIEENLPFMKVSSFDNSHKFKQKFASMSADTNRMSIGDFGKGVLFNQWKDVSHRTNRADGSILVPEEILSDIIYSASQHSVLLGNCPILVMNAPTVLIGRVMEDMQLDFKEKGAEGLKTDLGLEGIKLEAKTLYAYVEISEEDLQDVQNLDSILTRAFSMAVAKALDGNFLYTNPKAEEKPGIYPKGILDNENINKIAVSVTDYDMVAKANLEIAKFNGKSNTIGFNPNVNYKLQTMKDSIGQYITPPNFYNSLIQIESNGLKPNDVIVFDGSQILIGIRKEMDIKVLPDLKKGSVIMRCMLRADVLPIRENHICRITINEDEEKKQD